MELFVKVICIHLNSHNVNLLTFCCSAVDTIMQDSEIHNVFCIIRPPGHHAGVDGLVGKSVSQGFCLVNNIAIGARFALKQYSDTIKKVAIIDFDVHHGDGTENIVSGDNSIFFASLHAFDGEFYPGSGSFSFPSSGNVFNVPLELGYSSVEFLNALENSVIPSLRQFGPDMIFISAGFDARHGDAITEVRGSKGLSEDDYYRATLSITNLAWELCDGRVVSALEGGYGTDFLASCTVAHSCGMMDSSFMRKLSHNKSRILNQNMSK